MYRNCTITGCSISQEAATWEQGLAQSNQLNLDFRAPTSKSVTLGAPQPIKTLVQRCDVGKPPNREDGCQGIVYETLPDILKTMCTKDSCFIFCLGARGSNLKQNGQPIKPNATNSWHETDYPGHDYWTGQHAIMDNLELDQAMRTWHRECKCSTVQMVRQQMSSLHPISAVTAWRRADWPERVSLYCTGSNPWKRLSWLAEKSRIVLSDRTLCT